MPKLTIKSLQEALETARMLKALTEKSEAELTKRVALLSAENESLRADKRWLQQMLSPLAQALISRHS